MVHSAGRIALAALCCLAGIPPQAAVDPLALVAGVPPEPGAKKRQREAGTSGETPALG